MSLIGKIILERREEALKREEETIPIGDLGDARLLMERAFNAGWEWGKLEAQSETSVP